VFGVTSGCYLARGWQIERVHRTRRSGRHGTAFDGRGGRGYRTAAATLLASGPGWDQRLGDEPRRLLEVRVGGVDLSAVVGGRGWERLGWQAFLFRTTKGNHFVQFQSTWPGERDQLLPLSPDEAMKLYGELPEKKVSFEEAFPGVEIEEA
jgi:hypothetical protein